jgi:DNA replication protein DnaC
MGGNEDFHAYAAELLRRLRFVRLRTPLPGIGLHWPFESWGAVPIGHTTAVSLLHRLLHHCHTVITDGDSFRIKQARAGQGTGAKASR